MKQIKKAGSLFLPIILIMGVANCSKLQSSLKKTDEQKFLSQNPVFKTESSSQIKQNDEGEDGQCPSGYTMLSDGTCQSTSPTALVASNCDEDGLDTCDRNRGGNGGSDPLMIDSQGVEYADLYELRTSDESYFKSGELSFTAPEDGVKFNIMGQQTKVKLDNGQFLHIKPQAHNFKFQISWTKASQSRYRWLSLPDENGHINGIDELFGDNTFGPNPENPFAEDGFQALMKWDRGDASDSSRSRDLSDNYIDSNDAVFSKLRLWHDLNGDGNCDTDAEISSELVSLSDVGITYIHLTVNKSFAETDVYGNDITYKSLVGFTPSQNGATRLGTAFDVWFHYDSSEILSTGAAEIRND